MAMATALCRVPKSALPIPLGDPRSSILSHSTARRFPEMPCGAPLNGDLRRCPLSMLGGGPLCAHVEGQGKAIAGLSW